MRADILTVIILTVAVVSYALEKIPLVLTALLSMLAVYFAGILSFESAFSGFYNNAVMMVIGMGIFGIAFAETGIIDILIDRLQKLFLGGKGFSEKTFLMIGGALAAAMSIVVNPMLVMAIFMNIVDTLAARENSGIRRKNLVLPLAIASNYGGLLTSISLTTIIATSGLLAETSVGRPFHFFEPAIVGLPCLIMYFVVFGTFGIGFCNKAIEFDDSVSKVELSSEAAGHAGKSRQLITLVTLLVCVAFFVFSDFKLGAVAMAGGAVLMLTGCVNAKTVLGKLSWNTIFLVAASIGFAKAVDESGAGLMIANAVIGLFGSAARSGIGICIIALVVSSILSNFMSNSSTAMILVPIFVIIAEQAGVPVLPVVLATGGGASLVTATPLCTAHITQTASVGYRFMDYVKLGGLCNVFAILVSALSLYLVFFL